MFFPGETITHKFVVPFVADEIDHVVLSYKQKDEIVYEKTITSGFEDTEDHKCSFSFDFTQQEGLLFLDDEQILIQINVFTTSGSRYTSRLIKTSTGTQYLREVMSSG